MSIKDTISNMDSRKRHELLMAACRKDPATFIEYVMKSPDGKRFQLAPIHHEWLDLIAEHDKAIIWGSVEVGKAIPLSTPIPTPNGWTTMGALTIGDSVFGSDGRPCNVVFATETQLDRPLYRVVFDDGDTMLADEDHQWVVEAANDLHRPPPSADQSGTGPLCACGCDLRVAWNDTLQKWNRFIHNHHGRLKNRIGDRRVMTTKQMLSSGLCIAAGARRKDGSRYNCYKWRVPLAKTVEYAEQPLPVHPYVLGAWLGDGDGDAREPNLTCHVDDRFVVDKCIALEGGVHGKWSQRDNVLRVGVGVGTHCRKDGLLHRLRELNVLENKRIPESYRTASVAQRMDLLAGLLDTDGSISTNGRVEFSVCNARLAADTLELIRSLGFKATMRSGDAKLNGVVVNTRYRIVFTPDRPVFTLPRKLARQKMQRFGRAGYRCIVAIEPVQSEPVRCIQVDSPDSTYLMGRSYTVTHNTWVISIAYTAWEIGNDPTLRCIIMSKTDGQAVKILSGIFRTLMSEEYRNVFPNVRVINANSHIVKLDGWDGVNPTVQAFHFTGPIMGARVDRLIVDDPLDQENTSTEEKRQAMYDWYQNTLNNRLTSRSRERFIANSWHPRDMLHRFKADPGWVCGVYPIWEKCDADEPGSEFVPAKGCVMKSNWPGQWPLSRIKKKHEDMVGPNAVYFRRAYECIALDDRSVTFQQAWIDKALTMGRGLPWCYTIQDVGVAEEFVAVHIGVDLATKRPAARRKTDDTVFFVTGMRKNGNRRLLCIESGKFHGPDILRRMIDLQRRFSMGVIVMFWVETVSAQLYIYEFATSPEVVAALGGNVGDTLLVRSFETTGQYKMDANFGIESCAVEMAQGRWEFPNIPGLPHHHELQRLETELESYTPIAHSGDRLMALWFSKEGCRLGIAGIHGGTSDHARR